MLRTKPRMKVGMEIPKRRVSANLSMLVKLHSPLMLVISPLKHRENRKRISLAYLSKEMKVNTI